MKTLINVMLVTAMVLGAGARGRVGQQGAYGRAWGFTSDGQGNVEAGRIRGFQAPNAQASGTRRFSRNADGSLQRNSTASGAGPRGSYDTTGALHRDADGQVSAGRETDITGSEGNRYSGSATYSSEDGWSRTATCHDASGQVVNCPR